MAKVKTSRSEEPKFKRTLPSIKESDAEETVVEESTVPYQPAEVPKTALPSLSSVGIPNTPLPQEWTYWQGSIRVDEPIYREIYRRHHTSKLQSGKAAPSIQDIMNTCLEVGMAILRQGTDTELGGWMEQRMYERRERSRSAQSRKMTGKR